ncbi:MAG: cytochrome c [Chloroflexi bacterium]|nr:cytochrome c [Chloroflexota bacterium]
MDIKRLIRLAAVIALPLIGLALAVFSSPTPTPTPTSTPLPVADADEHQLFITNGCAACHGQNGDGSPIAPALAGHSEATVERQVRTPRLQMPSFTVDQISDEELELIADYIASLEGEGNEHHEGMELTAALEMHHWMALDAIEVGEPDEAIHHVQHIIDLLEAGDHHDRMEAVLEALQAGDVHDPEHEIEEMLAGTASPDLSLRDLHLQQAMAAIATDEVPDALHHVLHAQNEADPSAADALGEIVDLLNAGELHDAEHEIGELLSGEVHAD